MQNQQFSVAFGLASRGMKRDRSEQVWTEEMRNLFQPSQAEIIEFEVYPGKIEGESAYVPGITTLQDKFLHHLRVEERKLYLLVKEQGAWKIERQEAVVSSDDLAKWFPKQSASGCNRVR
jgi:hypothetical protein